MINVAIVDDVKNQVELLAESLIEYQNISLLPEIGINKFYSGEEVIAFYSKEELNLDIVFIDIEMGDLNGIETAKTIKERYPNMIIIFVSGYMNYAPDTFRVGAFQLIQKPITKEQLFKDFSRLFGRYKNMHRKLSVSWKGEIKIIEHQEVRYIEAFRRHLFIHMSTGNQECMGKLVEVENALQNSCFVKVHQGYLVNMKYIYEIRQQDILLKNKELIPISKHRRKDILTAFAKYMLGEGQWD